MDEKLCKIRGRMVRGNQRHHYSPYGNISGWCWLTAPVQAQSHLHQRDHKATEAQRDCFNIPVGGGDRLQSRLALLQASSFCSYVVLQPTSPVGSFALLRCQYAAGMLDLYTVIMAKMQHSDPVTVVYPSQRTDTGLTPLRTPSLIPDRN